MSSARHFVPHPRQGGLVRQELDGELLLYVEETHQASSLNAAAARLWALCDGKREVDHIAAEAPCQLEEVVAALSQFADAGLLENGADFPRVNFSRRRMLRTLGIAGPALLVVMAPMAAAACSPPGATCKVGHNNCCSGVCNPVSKQCE